MKTKVAVTLLKVAHSDSAIAEIVERIKADEMASKKNLAQPKVSINTCPACGDNGCQSGRTFRCWNAACDVLEFSQRGINRG